MAPVDPDIPKERFVRDPEQWSVLMSPVRFEILEDVTENGPCSIRETAARMGVKPDRLYRHFKTLVKHEFLRLHSERKHGTHAEQLFGLTAQDFFIDFSGADPKTAAKMLESTVRQHQRLVMRSLQRSASAGLLRIGGAESNVSQLFNMTWLTPDDFEKIRAIFRNAKAEADAARRRRTGQMYVWMMSLLPVTTRTLPTSRAVDQPGSHSQKAVGVADSARPKKPRRRR